MRALPLLRPGHSMAFATLPTGQDPDDLVQAEGARAFEAVLEKAEPLINRLWAHEVAAGPLDTPEECAGLTPRLREIASQLGHEDVRALHGQAFRDRLDALYLSRCPSTPAPSFRDRTPRRKKGFPPLFQPVPGEAREIHSSR